MYSIAQTKKGPHQYISVDDTIGKSLELYGEWANSEISFMLKFINEGDAVLDIGCNIGVHSMEFSDSVGSNGTIYSFDPQPEVIVCAISTGKLQGRKNIIFNAFGLSNKFKFATLSSSPISELNFGARYINSSNVNASSTTNGIVVAPLDALNLEKISLIKADIEGHEIPFLKGARKSIKKSKPLLFLEANDERSKSQIRSWAKLHFYTCLELEFRAFNKNNFKMSKENIFGEAHECMIMMIPLKQSATIRSRVEAIINSPQFSNSIRVIA